MMRNTNLINAKIIAVSVPLLTIYMLLNMYLGINFGWGFSYSIITLAIGSMIFRKHYKNKMHLITALLCLSILTSPFGFWWPLAILVIIRLFEPNSLPTWAIPSLEVLLNGVSSEWILPIIFNLAFLVLGVVAGFSLGLIIADDYLKYDLPYPHQKVFVNTLRAFVGGNTESGLVLKFLVIGIVIVFIQFSLSFLGVNLISYDFTPLLFAGASFAISFNLGLLAIGYIIPPRISVTMFVASLFTYLVIGPIAASFGIFTPGITEYENWSKLVFSIMLIFGLGAFLLGDVISMLLKKIIKRHSSTVSKAEYKSVSLIDYVNLIKNGLRRNKFVSIVFISSLIGLALLCVVLNIFGINMYLQILLITYLLIASVIIDSYLIAKMNFETGISSGMHHFLLYTIPVFVAGCRKYLGYIYPPTISWDTTYILSEFKIGDMLKVNRKTILLAIIINTLLSILLSIVLFLIIWYGIGFPSQTMPAVNVLLTYSIFRALVNGTLPIAPKISLELTILLFFLGGIIASIFSLLGVSVTGFAIGVLMPPSMTFMFGIGGLLRIFSDYKFGKDWFNKRGQYVASGFMAGALTTFIILSIVFRILSLI